MLFKVKYTEIQLSCSAFTKVIRDFWLHVASHFPIDKAKKNSESRSSCFAQKDHHMALFEGINHALMQCTCGIGDNTVEVNTAGQTNNTNS